MSLPLRCTSNSYGTIDYGIPIILQQTDYRTSTGTSHRYIPEVPQQFTRTVKGIFPPANALHDIQAKKYSAQTTYNENFYRKQVEGGAENSCPKAKRAVNVHFWRQVQEKIFSNPPAPIAPKISETKYEYTEKPSTLERRSVYPPNPYLTCKLCPPADSPSLDPEKEGYMKWLDPYLTTNRATYVPISVDRRSQYIYPKIGTLAGSTEPATSAQEGPIYDKMTFKTRIYDRIVHVAPPGFGDHKTSEYGRSYVPQTWSNFYTRIHGYDTEFPDSLPRSSAWQDLCAPGMYCTEPCHIGTGWPVTSLLDPLPDRGPHLMKPHKPCTVT